MINCIAIDDEPLALEVIKSFCQRIPYLSLKKTFTQTSEVLHYMENFPVDLVFLDIQMPDRNGIDFSKKLTQEVMIIFTTAYSNYAVQGFDVNAVDYLLKPLQFSRFEQACAKAHELFDYQQQKVGTLQNYLCVRSDYALVKIPFAEILYFETMDDYIKIHVLGRKPILTLMSMKKLLEKIPQTEFVRIHRSYVVPMNKIESVRAKSVFLGVAELPIGSSYEKAFFKIYTENDFGF